MAFTDWTIMLQNLASSLIEVEKMVSGAFYLLGVGLLINGIMGLKALGAPHQGNSDAFHVFLKLVVGVFFIYLPNSLEIATHTFFGTDTVLSFIKYEPDTVYQSIRILMQFVGLVWFGRGMLMFYESNENARLKSYVAFAYVFAGICALNLDYTVEAVTYAFNKLMSFFMHQ